MTFTINAVDAEFAVATGSNVNNGPGTSTFDYPPTSANGLVITANPGDPTPATFSLGDSYDLVYGNGGGGRGGTFEDAIVIRSDALPGGGHVVVFEGLNQNGELEQIVWTPGFDLESWYFDNFNQGNPPGFYTSDQNASTEYVHGYVCFSSETRIATARGEVPAGHLVIGDLVRTLDHGYQPILWIGRRRVRIDQKSEGAQPVLIEPSGFEPNALRHPIVVSPQHRLLLRSPVGEEMLAPAKAFVGTKGIRYMRGKSEVEYISLLLERHEILDVSGLATESFLPGPQGYLQLSQRETREIERVIARQRGRNAPSRVIAARRCLGGASGRRAIVAGAVPVLFQQCTSMARRAVG